VDLPQVRPTIRRQEHVACVRSVSDGGLGIGFSLPRRLVSRRINSIQEPARGWFVHRMRFREVGELDAELQRWLCESYHQMGMQERLRSSKR
jgi:hypothetical protein